MTLDTRTAPPTHRAGSAADLPDAPTPHEPARDARTSLRELLDDQRLAMLTTVEDDGQLRARPMTLLEVDREGRLWFFCDHDPEDRGFAQRHAQVNLAFVAEPQARQVSVSGQGLVSHDLERKRALWTPMARPWFPDGPTTPRLATLCVTPQTVEYWDGPDSRVVRALAMAASVAAGKPVGLGEHGFASPS